MYRTLGALVLTLILAAPAEARQRVYHAHPDCNVLWPCEGVGPSPRGERVVKAMGGFGSARKVYTPRAAKVDYRRVVRKKPARKAVQAPQVASNLGVPSLSIGYSIARPARYIAGRLVCAINVGVALAERGIKGTGSASALSYLGWGRSAGGPVPGAVIVSRRRGGGPCGHRLAGREGRGVRLERYRRPQRLAGDPVSDAGAGLQGAWIAAGPRPNLVLNTLV